jgi:drug/metabolite transporter (DMT)-like permease
MDAKLLAVATALCFGISPVVLKLGFGRRGRTDVAVFIGLVLTIPLYLAFSPFVGGIHFEYMNLQAWVGFILGGLFGGAIGRRWMYRAIERLGASPASAVKNSAPLITTALSIPLLGEHVSLVRWLAIVVIVAGITLVTWGPGWKGGQFLNAGLLAAVGSAISYGIRPLFLKYGLEAADVPLTGALVGTFASVIYAGLLTPRHDLWVGLRGPGSGLFAISGILQGLGFLALTFGLSKAPASVVYPVTSAAPLCTVVLTALLLRKAEHLNWRIVAGTCAIVIGVIKL